ncbi:MAG: hypothetical protein ACYTAN_06465 [Planctomycetota bacterium]|jgi:hypothetical protein
MLTEAVILKDVFPFLRRRGTYARRTLYAAAAAVLVLVNLTAYSSSTPEEAAKVGRAIFDIILWLILIAGLFECTFQGATAVSTEREKNTVDLWVLAGLEHVGMVVSKAASVLARTAATLAAPAVPAVTAVFMGGRSVQDAHTSFIALAAILVLATSVAVSVSAVSPRNASSVPSAIGAVFFAVAGPWAAAQAWVFGGMPGSGIARALLGLHPFTILGQVGEEMPEGFLGRAYLSAFGLAAISLLLLVLAGLKLRRQKTITRVGIQPFVACDAALRRVCPRLYHLFKPKPGNPDDQPVLWRERIALANMKKGFGVMTVSDKLGFAVLTAALFVLGWTFLGAGEALAVLGAFWAISFLYQVGFAVRVSQGFSREFESGQMDLINLTQLDGETIVMGKLRAFARHWSPAAAVTFLWAFSAFAYFAHLAGTGSDDESRMASLALFAPFAWVFGGLSISALALLCSLYFRSGVRSLYATAVTAFLVPLIATGVLGIFACPAMMMPWEVTIAAEIVLMGAVLISVLVYVRNYDRSRFYAKQEVLVLAIFAVAVVPRLAGGLLGPICVYLILQTLMRREFDGFLKDEPLLEPPGVPPVALSYEKRGVFSFTHLGVPPLIEKRLGRMLEKVTGREIVRDHGETNGRAGTKGRG